MDVSHANDELGLWRHGPPFNLPRTNSRVEYEFPNLSRNSETRK